MSLKQLKRDFDVRRYLEDRDVAYSAEGDNVSDGWIGLRCVFCQDHKDHLGVNLERNNFYCWICGARGDVVELIMELEQVSFPVARVRLEQYRDGFRTGVKRERKRREYNSLLPEGFGLIDPSEPSPLVRDYFRRRRFSLSLCEKYRLGYVSHGEYKMRLIVPIYLDGMTVSFQALDMTGRAAEPFLDCPVDRARMPNRSLVYGLDGIGEGQVVLVESVTDKWRMGNDAVALFTKNWTVEQLRLLHGRARGRRVKVLLDADAGRDAERLAFELSANFPDVVRIDLDSGDPADLSDEEVRKILAL